VRRKSGKGNTFGWTVIILAVVGVLTTIGLESSGVKFPAEWVTVGLIAALVVGAVFALRT